MSSNRLEMSEAKRKQLFGNRENPLSESDPEFVEIYHSFVFGEVYQQGSLSDKMKEMINLVVLTTVQNSELLANHIRAALKSDVSPVEIKEAVYQCAPYIGFARTSDALLVVNNVLKEENISFPVEAAGTVNEENRFDKGLEVQKSIFGPAIDQMHQFSPENQKHIYKDYLSAFCFGDIYTRGVLDLEIRELLTLSVLISLGGCESQVKSHIQGNLSVGNDKETMISVITQCLPYIGFPRTLNALTTLNEIVPEEKK